MATRNDITKQKTQDTLDLGYFTRGPGGSTKDPVGPPSGPKRFHKGPRMFHKRPRSFHKGPRSFHERPTIFHKRSRRFHHEPSWDPRGSTKGREDVLQKGLDVREGVRARAPELS